MTEADIKKLIDSEIKKFVADALDKEVKKILTSKSTQSRAELIDIIRTAMESVFKTLWVKRDFWGTGMK